MGDQAPIAKVIIRNGKAVMLDQYAPGLPDGDHDLYCEPDPRVRTLEQIVASLCNRLERIHVQCAGPGTLPKRLQQIRELSDGFAQHTPTVSRHDLR